MTRLLAASLVFTSFSFFALAENNQPTQTAPNTNIEYFTPQPPPSSQLKREEALDLENKDYNQYTGDHGFMWYQKHEDDTNKYITFDLNYTLADDADITVNNVEYPAVPAEDAGLGYRGTIDLKGGLGLGMAFGYQKDEAFRYELEFTYSRMYINQFVDSFADVSKDSGNYIEQGPEVIEDQNDVLKAFSGFANIVFNLGKSKKTIPYVGAGYGYGLIGVSSSYDASPVYQFKGGIIHKLNDKMRLYVGVKQVFYGDVTYAYKVEENNTANTAYNERIYTIEQELKTMVFSIGYKFNF